jgi:hypothetical protein
MAQLQGIEEGQANIKDQSFKTRDVDMQAISKLENAMRFQDEQNKFIQQDMVGKIKNLEEQVRLSDGQRTEMRDKLRVAEDGNREMITFIKNL